MQEAADSLPALCHDPEASDTWRRRAARVAERHRAWRGNFPAVGALLDSDEERARALAGNYVTEGRETLVAWLDHREAASVSGTSVPTGEETSRLVDAYLGAWRREVLAATDVAGLEGAAHRRFVEFFDELTERSRAEAAARITRPVPPEAPSDRGALRPLLGIAGWLRNFFFPAGPR